MKGLKLTAVLLTLSLALPAMGGADHNVKVSAYTGCTHGPDAVKCIWSTPRSNVWILLQNLLDRGKSTSSPRLFDHHPYTSSQRGDHCPGPKCTK